MLRPPDITNDLPGADALAAIDEDIPALENQQRGLNSPFAVQGPFSPLLETNVASFAHWYARQMLER